VDNRNPVQQTSCHAATTIRTAGEPDADLESLDRQRDPAFEDREGEGRACIASHLPDCPDAVLESQGGYSYGYQDGIWVCLDPGGSWISAGNPA
jgi:hypothetical protein